MVIQILRCSSEIGSCCKEPAIVLLINTASRIIGLIQIIVPIILIIMASIKFTKMVINPDEKKGLKPIKNMFIAAAIIFFIPLITDVALNMLPEQLSITDCFQQARTLSETHKTTNLEYLAPYDTEEKQKAYTSPEEYEKGKPKPPTTPGESENQASGETIAPGDVSGILDGADKVHKMYEQNKWEYYSDLSQLKWGNIKYSTNNPSKKTCCATFVGSALYIGGVFSENEMNKYNYNSQYGISELCQEHGWTKITNYNQLAAGDIVIMSGPKGGTSPGHVQIYAGNGTWYNAGSTDSIQRKNPYLSDASARFLWAWRKPV